MEAPGSNETPSPEKRCGEKLNHRGTESKADTPSDSMGRFSSSEILGEAKGRSNHRKRSFNAPVRIAAAPPSTAIFSVLLCSMVHHLSRHWEI